MGAAAGPDRCSPLGAAAGDAEVAAVIAALGVAGAAGTAAAFGGACVGIDLFGLHTGTPRPPLLCRRSKPGLAR